MSNVYYDPEKFGLTVIAVSADPDASWDFDFVVVWKDDLNRVYAAQDSGCSCPTPFEDYRGVSELRRIREVRDLDAVFDESYRISEAEKNRIRSLVREVLLPR